MGLWTSEGSCVLSSDNECHNAANSTYFYGKLLETTHIDVKKLLLHLLYKFPVKIYVRRDKTSLDVTFVLLVRRFRWRDAFYFL